MGITVKHIERTKFTVMLIIAAKRLLLLVGEMVCIQIKCIKTIMARMSIAKTCERRLKQLLIVD